MTKRDYLHVPDRAPPRCYAMKPVKDMAMRHYDLDLSGAWMLCLALGWPPRLPHYPEPSWLVGIWGGRGSDATYWGWRIGPIGVWLERWNDD